MAARRLPKSSTSIFFISIINPKFYAGVKGVSERSEFIPCNNYVHIISRVYYKEGGRVSYSSIVPCTAVVRVQARLMIFTTCGTFTVYTTWQARCVLLI